MAATYRTAARIVLRYFLRRAALCSDSAPAVFRVRFLVVILAFLRICSWSGSFCAANIPVEAISSYLILGAAPPALNGWIIDTEGPENGQNAVVGDPFVDGDGAVGDWSGRMRGSSFLARA